jgi:hypothetical protein
VSGMSAASGSATPGDPLYGIKRSAERTQWALAGSDVTKGQLSLDFARNRRREAEAVRTDPVSLAAVLTDMDGETRQGVHLLTIAAVSRHEKAALDVIDAFVVEQRRELGALYATLSPVGRARAQTSIALLDDVATRFAALRSTLGCRSLADSVIDQLGPRPHCEAQQPTQPQQGGGPANQPAGGGANRTGPAKPAGVPTESGVPTPPPDSHTPGLLDDLGHLIGGLFHQ